MNTPITHNIVIAGGLGRMGRNITECAMKDDAINHITALVRDKNASHQPPYRDDALYTIMDDAHEAIAHANLIIDFSNIDNIAPLSSLAAQANCAYMCGITGIDASHIEAMQKAARHVPVLWASNTSFGVNLLHILAEMVASALPDYDIEVVEKHHRYKKDAPSGTALTLGAAIAQGLGKDFDDIYTPPYNGLSDGRPNGTIGFSAVRGGDIIGEHQLLFLSALEEIELHHKAKDRMLFANGAIKAGLWLTRQPAGYYSMRDMLGL